LPVFFFANKFGDEYLLWAAREFEFFPLLIEGTHLDIFLESHGDVVCYSGVVVLNSWRFNRVEVENWKT
jgi:hypothetical protein